MDTNLQMGLRQQLKLTQSQIQKLEMLALSSQDLDMEIRREEEKNPFLDVSYSSYSFDSTHTSLDSTIEYVGDDDAGKANWLERAIGEKESLTEHVDKQIEMLDVSDGLKNALLRLSSSLDDNGFLPRDVGPLFKPEEMEYVPEALRVIKTLDPVGIGASSVEESLKLQLADLHLAKEDEENISFMIDNLGMLKNGRTALVAKALDIDQEEADMLYSILKSLTPYPGEKFNTNWDSYVNPELTIKRNADGELEISDASENLPSVSLDPEYLKFEDDVRAQKDPKNKEALSYLREYRQKAEDIIDAVNLRKVTLHRLGLYLADKQRAFFDEGPSKLVPDTQSAVAQQLDLSISTISRICSNKYVSTDWGVFPFSFFFSSSSGFAKDDENALSKNAVKEKIKEIISSNDSGKALSDQKISDRLGEMGIKCARRTVTKYRKELEIDTSYTRES